MQKQQFERTRSHPARNERSGSRGSIPRRHYLASTLTVAAISLGGCLGDDDDDGDDDDGTAEEDPALDVSTGDATDVGATTATLSGEVTELVGIDDVDVGFEYGTDGELDSTVDAGTLTAADTFEAAIEELDPETTYEFRATATGGGLSAEGETVSFTTEELVADHTVRVHGTEFTPDELTIQVGETVEWVFEGGGHNVFVSEAPEESDWDGTEGTGTHPQGHVHKYRFTVPGTYEYNCSPHSHLGMEGTIIVED